MKNYILNSCIYSTFKDLKNNELRSAIACYRLKIFEKKYKYIYRTCLRHYNSCRQRVLRLHNHIRFMLLDSCLFLTLTFDDYHLYKNSFRVRRRKVINYLNSLNSLYVANIDYGKLNGREHYHALVQIDKVNNNDWVCGALNFKKCYNDNSKALSEYISKFTNHALKETTGGSHLIYSSKFSYYDLSTKAYYQELKNKKDWERIDKLMNDSGMLYDKVPSFVLPF